MHRRSTRQFSQQVQA